MADGNIDRRKYDRWTVDKRIPVAVVMSIVGVVVMQTLTAVWYASSLNNRVEVLEKRDIVTSTMPERMARIETMIEQVVRTMDRLERRSEKAIRP